MSYVEKLKRRIRKEPFSIEEALWASLGLIFAVYTMYVGKVTTEVMASLVIIILLIVLLAIWSYSIA